MPNEKQNTIHVLNPIHLVRFDGPLHVVFGLGGSFHGCSFAVTPTYEEQRIAASGVPDNETPLRFFSCYFDGEAPRDYHRVSVGGIARGGQAAPETPGYEWAKCRVPGCTALQHAESLVGYCPNHIAEADANLGVGLVMPRVR